MKSTPSLNAMQDGFKELKQRLLFVLFGLVVFRIGAHIPVPGLDMHRLAEVFNQHQGGVLGLFNMFSGGALSKLTVFALGVMPYISASIMMQLFSVAIPTFAQLKKEGARGQRKINQYTRYGTVALGIFQSFGISKWLVSQHIVLQPGLPFYVLSVVTLTTGTLFLMWLGEQMTEKGVGNGISLIIFAGIVSRFPQVLGQLFSQVRQGQMQMISLVFILGLITAVTAFVVFMERAQRRITVNYAKRQVGNKLYGGQSSHLPLKINMAGVIPPIFASSIILFPATLASWFARAQGLPWLNEASIALAPGQPLYLLCFVLAIFFFCFFYTALVFNPKETADNLKKSGALVPGMRPGDQTAQYIDKVMSRLTLSGAAYLALVSLLPTFLITAWHVPFYFGGTSLLIVVVVIMDFISQIQAHLMSYKYENLMKKGGKSSQLGLLR